MRRGGVDTWARRCGALALLAAGLLATGAAASEAELSARLAARLAVPALRGTAISALVVDGQSGATVFAREPDRALVPASNLKVLTALAALETFGPAHRFTTEILAPAPPDAQGTVETLYVRGGGDPSLTSERLWRLAADLRALGVQRIGGDLVVDDSLFDDERWHPDWGDVTARAYHAPVGALMANYGAFRVTVVPGPRAGTPATVTLDPPVTTLRLDAAVSTRAGGGADLRVERISLPEAERVRVRGAVPVGGEPRSIYRSVAEPERYAAGVLRLQLQAVGIATAGSIRSGPVPPGAVSLLAFDGAPLAEVVRLLLKHSSNPIAESLVKSLGVAAGGGGPAGRGSWPRGVAAERRVLAELGLPLDGARLMDGSGLSRGNRVSARLLVAALRLAQQSFAIGPELESALPIAGADGTLERRAADAAGRVRAKTGRAAATVATASSRCW